MLCVGLLIHNCYLVLFTGKRTGQFFIDKSVSLTAINMYLLVRKVLYNGPKIFPTSAPHLIYKNPNRLIHGALQISIETRNTGNVDILDLFGDSVSCLLITRFRFVKQIQHYA